ncbi:MAG: hypothetical protein IJV90_05975 [Candidatus Methanomethylophilaceae archaeon]|nr:hypothetical protein [Candidatus Methanomethylophilaceae archaeon]
MMKKIMTTEVYSSVKDDDGNEWYITVQKVERSECTFYNIQKEKSGDGRSRSEIQVDEAEAKVLLAALKEALGVKG